MYKEWLKKYGGWALLGLVLIAVYNLFDELLTITDWLLGILNILQPFVIGAALAYLLYIPAKAVEKRILKSQNRFFRKHARSLSVILIFLLFIALIIGTVMFLIPVIRNNIEEIAMRLPIYAHQMEVFFADLAKQLNIPTTVYISLYAKLSEAFNSLFNFKNFEAWDLINQGVSVVHVFYTWLMAIVICPYLLFERDRLLRILDTVMSLRISERDIRFIHRYAAKVNRIVSNFIFGKALDSLIIGIIAYIGFKLMGLRFDLLLALVVMVTNMIPYFGPFIGGIPVTIITALTMGMTQGIWTGIFIICLQQFDGFILGPFILGGSVGVSALWIIFAITFFGGTMGVVGMFLGVPMIAVLQMVFHDYIRYRRLRAMIQKNDLLDRRSQESTGNNHH